MLKLAETPYGLEYNDSIIARVQAVNAAGLKGEWRESDDSAKVKTVPSKLESAPRRGQSTDNDTLHVEWDKMDIGSPLTGGSEIIYYSVYLADSTEALYSTMESFYLYSKIDGETENSFVVTATNIYGEGEKSEASDAIVFGEVPAKLGGLTSENVDGLNTKATFSWTLPDDAITKVTIQVLDLSESAYRDLPITEEEMTTALSDLGYTVEASVLTADFGYQAGDRIRFRASATNEFGDSEWAYPTNDDMSAKTLLMLL